MAGVDLAGIACLVTGSSRSLTLGADGTVGAGTFTLLDASGASVVTGTVTAGSCTVTLGGAVAVGGRYSLVWAVTIDGTSRRLIQPALVAYSDFALPPTIAGVVPQLTGLTAPPAGWGETVASAWYRVLLDLWQRWPALRSADQMLASPAVLAQLCIYAAASQASILAGAYTGGVARDWHEVWEARYRDGWRDIMLAMDADGDGVAEGDPVRARPASFPPQTPAAGR
jgi:hypothetical protein